MSKPKVYVACSLTHAPKKFVGQVEKFKEKLESICDVLHFVGISDDTPHDTYLYDVKKCVYGCDLLVAICDYPSTGLGYEMATQVEKRKKPVLAVAHKNSLVTKLILDPKKAGYEFHRYENLCADVLPMVYKKLARMKKTPKTSVKQR